MTRRRSRESLGAGLAGDRPHAPADADVPRRAGDGRALLVHGARLAPDQRHAHVVRRTRSPPRSRRARSPSWRAASAPAIASPRRARRGARSCSRRALGLVVALPIRVANGALLGVLFPAAGPEVLADAGAYLHIVLPVLPLAFVEAIAAASLQGSGDTRTPLFVAAAGNVVNFAASWVLIFGRFGAPELGIRGAAIGNAATMAIEGVLLAAVLLSRRSPLPLRASPDGPGPRRRRAPPRAPRLRPCRSPRRARTTRPSCASSPSSGCSGPRRWRPTRRSSRSRRCASSRRTASAVAAGAVVAQKLGAGKPGEATRAGWIAVAMAMALLTSLGLVFALAPRVLVGGVLERSGDRRARRAGAAGDGGRAAVHGLRDGRRRWPARRGGHAHGARLTVVCVVVVRLVATYVFVVVLGFGLAGVWMGSTADWMCRAGILGVAYARGRWRRVRV